MKGAIPTRHTDGGNSPGLLLVDREARQVTVSILLSSRSNENCNYKYKIILCLLIKYNVVWWFRPASQTREICKVNFL